MQATTFNYAVCMHASEIAYAQNSYEQPYLAPKSLGLVWYAWKEPHTCLLPNKSPYQSLTKANISECNKLKPEPIYKTARWFAGKHA